jgi:hydrogenase expression/formation protein HypE
MVAIKMSESPAKPRPAYVRPLDLERGQVDMAHGAGGRAMAQLIDELFARHLGNEFLDQGDDGAVMPVPADSALNGRLVMATDSHVVSPLFFPGGDIGCLAVHGTLNDVAVMGAVPRWLSAAFILEEGFPLKDLLRIVKSMAQAAMAAGVPIVTGDTKVVERGKGDGVFITTTGVGFLPAGRELSGRKALPGDVILLSGTLGDHGMAIMAERESLGFAAPIVSDTAALHGLIGDLLASGAEIHTLRDPTRGGLATTLNEIARQSGVGMMLEERQIPVAPAVAAACEFLGLDPLYVANEGKLVVICAESDAKKALTALRGHPLGQQAAIIGTVHADPHHFVQMTTALGGRRIVDWLSGDQLPRIC